MSDSQITPFQPENPSADPAPSKPKRARGNAINRLQKETAKTVRDNSEKIAKALLDHTIKGDVRCAKLLLELLEKYQSRTKRKSSRIRKFFESLTPQPGWEHPPSKNVEFHDPERVLIRRDRE